MAEAKAQMRGKIRNTGIEKKLNRALRQQPALRGKFQRWVIIGSYEADFAFPHVGLIVEADGWYWHNRLPEQLARTKERDEFLHRRGWGVLHFTDIAIRTRLRQCVHHVVEVVTRWEKSGRVAPETQSP